MKLIRTLAVPAFLALVPAFAAGQGRADLRYVAPVPATVIYTGVDTMHATTTGLPMGEMQTSTTLRAVNEIRFAADSAGMKVTAQLKELTGEAVTPMGSMPVTLGPGTEVEIHIGERGPDPEDDALGFGAMGGGMNANAMAGITRAVAGLMALPGRELRLGETWSDTTHLTPSVEGLTLEVHGIVNGTYVADTVVDGRTLNVLRIRTDMTTKASGTVQGNELTQNTTTKSEETVLWDSARHMLAWRDANIEMQTSTTLPAQGVTMNMDTRMRSILTATPEG